ncbi:MAG: TetR/AcrR family transcriptional regulator [Aliishimia sp.]
MRLNESGTTPSTTRYTIRAVAEELFAQKRIDGVTTRALAEAAGVNMAAINYHYGSKENLTLAIFRDVARRTVLRRHNSLDEIEAQAAAQNSTPVIHDVINAFVDAYVNEDSPRTGFLLAHLVLQHRVRPTDWTRAVVLEELDGFAIRYIKVLHRAAPHLSETEIHWRYNLMVGTVMMSVSGHKSDKRMKELSNDLCAPEDLAELKDELVAFLVNSFGQPETAEINTPLK